MSDQDYPSLDELLAEIERQTSLDNSLLHSAGTSTHSQSSPELSAGMQAIAALESSLVGSTDRNKSSPSPVDVSPASGVVQLGREMIGGGAPRQEQFGSVALENQATQRQRRLPKLSYRMLGSIAAMLVLAGGLGTALLLTQQNQDIRQYASDPQRQEVPSELQPFQTEEQASSDSSLEDVSREEESSSTNETINQESVRWYRQPVVVAVAAAVASVFILLLVFLHWLFAV